MCFDWCFGTSVLRSYGAGGEYLPSTEMILHPMGGAKQGGFSMHLHSTLYAREASAAQAASFKAH
jgi:hypothetical protein